MALITVDQEKCKRDGICVAECPMRIIALNEDDPTPVPIENADKLCINCGHCVAVCPHGALSLRGMAPEQCPPVQKDMLLTPEQVEHFMRTRRSIRTYEDKPVDRERITKLIDIARFAPTGHNFQPVRWLVIHDSDEVRKLSGMVIDWMRYMIREQPEIAASLKMGRVVNAWEAGIDSICRGAPHIILAYALKDNPTAPSACTIALTYLELAALPLGLGTCWAGYFNVAATMWPPMQKALGLPKGCTSYGAMMVGYAKYDYYRLPLRNDPQIMWC